MYFSLFILLLVFTTRTKTSRDSIERVKIKVVSVKDRRNNKSDQTGSYGSCDARYETVREMLALPVVCVVVLSENRPIVHRGTENAVSAYVRWNVLRIIGYYVLVLRYALSIETILKCISMITIGIHARTLREGRHYACARIVSTRKINELFSRVNSYRSYHSDSRDSRFHYIIPWRLTAVHRQPCTLQRTRITIVSSSLSFSLIPDRPRKASLPLLDDMPRSIRIQRRSRTAERKLDHLSAIANADM